MIKPLLAAASMNENNRFCEVNMNLLPIKAHYFFLFGAMSGVVPFMPVLAKSLGISATAVGLTYTVLPFLVFLSKPIFGFLTDRFQDIKVIMIILVVTISISFLLVLLIPGIQVDLYLQCSEENRSNTNVPLRYRKECFVSNLEHGLKFKYDDDQCDTFKICGDNCTAKSANVTVKSFDEDTLGQISLGPSSTTKFVNGKLLLLEIEAITSSNSICDCIHEHSSSLSSTPLLDSCASESRSEEPSSVYLSYQFWIFTLLAVISGTGSATSFCLSDAACYEVLGDQPHLYGRQRLWATISWGIITLLTGLFNDLATGDSYQTNYSPGFYLMAALVVIDVIILLKIKLRKANFSSSICKDVGRIFASSEMVAFATGVFINGAFTGLLWNYQFWFLQDIGANQTLLGLTVAVQCLAAEVPFFFFAGFFIEKLGHFYCISASFAAFALRYGLYYFLKDPWLILPIEILHGLTFALFYASMTSYASKNAPPGTEATTLGVLGGLFEGLGVAVGSLLGGIGFDSIGGRNTFLTAAIISLFCAPSFVVIHIFHRMTGHCQKTSESL